LLGWNSGADGGSGTTAGVVTHGIAGAGGLMGDVTMAGPLGAVEGNGPDDKCADGICLRPHADFLLASLAAFSSPLSVSTNFRSLSILLYFD